MIGQNLIDIAQPESAAEIADCLKPSIVPSLARSSAVEESTVSQFRQFYVKFRPPSKSTTFPVWAMCMCAYADVCMCVHVCVSDCVHEHVHVHGTDTSVLHYTRQCWYP